MSETAKPETQPETQTEQPKAAKAPKTKTVRVRSLVGPFLILHSNTMIGADEEKKVEIDPWTQAQINAGKLEIVVD